MFNERDNDKIPTYCCDLLACEFLCDAAPRSIPILRIYTTYLPTRTHNICNTDVCMCIWILMVPLRLINKINKNRPYVCVYLQLAYIHPLCVSRVFIRKCYTIRIDYVLRSQHTHTTQCHVPNLCVFVCVCLSFVVEFVLGSDSYTDHIRALP